MSELERSAVLVEHDGTEVVRVTEWPPGLDAVVHCVQDLGASGFAGLNAIAAKFPGHWLVWCRAEGALPGEDQRRLVETLVPLPRHRQELWHGGSEPAILRAVGSLGYIDLDDPVLLGGSGRHASWLISERCGIAHCSLFAAVPWGDGSGDLCASWIDFGRRVSRAGCLCMAEPELLVCVEADGSRGTQRLNLGPMIEHCYGERWLRFWWFSRLLFGNGRLSALWCLVTWVLRSAVWSRLPGPMAGDFPDPLPMVARDPRPVENEPRTGGRAASGRTTVSVVIPTFGREGSLRNLFLDLEAQDIANIEVVVVEQRPEGAVAYDPDLFVGTTFRCIHRVVDWIGAGRARNLGVGLVSGEWVLFVDDDVGFLASFLTELLVEADVWAVDALCAAVVTPVEEQRARVVNETVQPYQVHKSVVEEEMDEERRRLVQGGALTWTWSGMAGCSSLVRRCALLEIDGFDERLDLGYGEDYELGVRLRRSGAVVMTTNRVALVHLHAPVGGFRALEGMDWGGKEEPKPSPYVLLSRDGLSVEMQRAYQLIYLMRQVASGVVRSPRQILGMVRRLRSAHRWKERFRSRSCGGIPNGLHGER